MEKDNTKNNIEEKINNILNELTKKPKSEWDSPKFKDIEKIVPDLNKQERDLLIYKVKEMFNYKPGVAIALTENGGLKELDKELTNFLDPYNFYSYPAQRAIVSLKLTHLYDNLLNIYKAELQEAIYDSSLLINLYELDKEKTLPLFDKFMGIAPKEKTTHFLEIVLWNALDDNDKEEFEDIKRFVSKKKGFEDVLKRAEYLACNNYFKCNHND